MAEQYNRVRQWGRHLPPSAKGDGQRTEGEDPSLQSLQSQAKREAAHT